MNILLTDTEKDILLVNAIIDNLKTEWYNWLYKNDEEFENLSMDSQGIYVMELVKYFVKYVLYVPDHMLPDYMLSRSMA